MIRIKYPVISSDLNLFHELYVKKLRISLTDRHSIDSYLGRIIFQGGPLSMERVLLMDFINLPEVNYLISHHLNYDELDFFITVINYKNKQDAIADFFMNQSQVPLDSCFYCNIDSIYCFADLEDFEDSLAFVNRGKIEELMRIKHLGETKAREILNGRRHRPYLSLEDVPVGTVVRERIREFDFSYTHNHFTLDHFFHKAKYSFISLCLYNFVPSCYSCNSKFKGYKDFSAVDKMTSISPISPDFEIRRNFKFKLFLRKELDQIKSVEDFAVISGTIPTEGTYAHFLKTFKILGRYRYHKPAALDLILKKVAFPESKVNEMAQLLGKSVDEVRSDFFGKELFEERYDQKPLVKFMRDIARSMRLEDVLDS